MQTLRQWLTRNSKTQFDLAREIGVSQPTVSDWLNDNVKPSTDNLIALSDLTGISIDQLVREVAASQ